MVAMPTLIRWPRRRAPGAKSCRLIVSPGSGPVSYRGSAIGILRPTHHDNGGERYRDGALSYLGPVLSRVADFANQPLPRRETAFLTRVDSRTPSAEPLKSKLPYDSGGGKIIRMGRDTIRNQTPDLFSTGTGPRSEKASEAETTPPPRRSALPNDLPRALRHLDDRELDLLLRAAIDEARRRGRSPLNRDAGPTATDTSSAQPGPKEARPPGKLTRQRQIGLAASALTQGQVNAVRAAFKAGVTLARIARQFGLSHADVRRALAGEKSKI
jgi:hypothetical protein